MTETGQDGEGAFLSSYFKDLPPGERLLVDVGAYGKEFSNSWGLLSAGWKGLLIEANPQRVPVIESDFAGLDFKLLNVAIGNQNATDKLYIHNRIGSSSLLPDWSPEGKTGQVVDVSVRVFAEVLRENSVPSNFPLLNIDTEGMDKEILDGLLKTEFKPRAILTEVFSYGSDTKSVLFFLNYGYRFVNRFEIGNPWGNMMFAR